MTYEPPQITTVGSVHGLTRGGENLMDWSDEVRLGPWTFPAPGGFTS